jgi:hypothetical protein
MIRTIRRSTAYRAKRKGTVTLTLSRASRATPRKRSKQRARNLRRLRALARAQQVSQ